MRNGLIHVYFRLDLSVIWDTAVNDAPVLEQRLSDILQHLPPDQ